MKKKNRIFATLLLAIGWGVSLSIARAWLAPAIGAATVMQLDASNASYATAMNFMSIASIVSVVISLVFALLIYLVLRTK